MVKYDAEYYKNKIIEFHDVDDKKLKYNLRKWSDKIAIQIYVANNEQKAWTASMLGHETLPMLTKSETGYYQVGDYNMYMPEFDMYVGICGERKSIADAYGTLITNLSRFHREITRCYEDDRFDHILVIVEGTYEEFMNYQPSFKGGKFNRGAWAKRANGAQHNAPHKVGVLNSLYARGVPVIFAGSRDQAAKTFVDVSKKWIRYNYIKILQLE